MIPGYCNNRLNAVDKAEFEQHLEESQELQAELHDFREFQDLYRQADPLEPPPSDALFDQISQKVGIDQQVKEKSDSSHTPSSNLSDILQNLWKQARESLSIPWMLAAAQAVAIVILLAPAPQQTTYSTLSAGSESSAHGTIGFNVVFQPSARESDIRTLLRSIDGTLSDGPSLDGRYVVTLQEEKNRDVALNTLKHSNIIIFAEPVY